MHIPDGYLGPQTYLPALGVMGVLWGVAVAKLKKSLRLRQVPLLALGAAFSFVIMMFNVPIPGGTTGHAVGAVLVAILFGPWAAVVAVSLALAIQALLFGDGGITALGANCLNMAVICPFVGWGVYRLIAGAAPVRSRRHWIGGALGGWLGLTAAALVAGVEFGIQPLLAHDAAGRALYCPFGLAVAVPAMALTHLLVFGLIEGLVTALVVAHFQRTAPEMLSGPGAARRPMALVPKLAIVVLIMLLLVPLGLYLPAWLHAGPAWGEWNAQQVQEKVGYTPSGLGAAEAHGFHAPLPNYAAPGQASAPLPARSTWYLLSGAVGVMAIGLALLLLRGVLSRKGGEADAALVEAHPRHPHP